MKNIKTTKELAEKFYKNLEEFLKTQKNENIFSIFDKWEFIIGNSKLAAKCELEDIKNNTLILKTYHTGWSQQILLQKKQIIKNINKLYPNLKIENISIIIEDEIKQSLPKKTEVYIPIKEDFNEIEEFEKDKKLHPELDKALKALKKQISKKYSISNY